MSENVVRASKYLYSEHPRINYQLQKLQTSFWTVLLGNGI